MSLFIDIECGFVVIECDLVWSVVLLLLRRFYFLSK